MEQRVSTSGSVSNSTSGHQVYKRLGTARDMLGLIREERGIT